MNHRLSSFVLNKEYHVPTPNESPLCVVHSHGSDEGSLKLNELTNLVTILSERIGVLEDDLKWTKQTYSAAFTKLILMIKKLESKLKTRKARKRARVVLSEDEEDDSSKHGRIDEDPNTYFAQDDEVVHEQDTAAERQPEDSTAGITVSTAPINISTTRETHSTPGRVVYGKRSKEARKDKGKAIMTEPEPEKNSKKLLEQERLDEERVTTGTKTTKDIDWNDPSVQKYWDLKNKPKSEAQARKNMIVYWKNQKQIKKDTTGKRKKSLPRKRTRSTTKRQKVELDDEKEYLKGYLDIAPREDVVVDVDSLSTKYLIVDWKTYTLLENFMYYKIIKGDGSSKNYKILSEMLYDFDRQDIVELYRLVKERYSSSKPEGYDLMLWGDLHTLFEPDEESEIWMNQNEYNLISWSLCDFCGVHILLMQNGIAIHMLTEKKYPLSQEMISKMLSKRLEVDQESTQAYELLKFIRSQVKKIDQGLGSTPDIDPFLEDIKEKEINMDDWDQLLYFNLDAIPQLGGEELPPFEEAAKEALALKISQKFALLEEVKPVLKTMAYHDKYKKVLNEIWKDKVELDGIIVKEEEEAIKRLKVNENALADTGSDINTMPYRIYERLRREEMKKVGVSTLIAKFLILDIPIDRDAPIVVGRGFLSTIGSIVNTTERLFSTFDGFCHQTFRVARSDVLRTAKIDSDDNEEYKIKRNKFRAPIYGLKPAPYLNCNDLAEQLITDKSKKGVGYNAVPSPHPLILNRPTTLDLSYSGLEEFKEPEVNEYGPRDSSLKPTTGCDKEPVNTVRFPKTLMEVYVTFGGEPMEAELWQKDTIKTVNLDL
ncbi:hypothetical protein Tco_1429300 [Tanacetum coccineum]